MKKLMLAVMVLVLSLGYVALAQDGAADPCGQAVEQVADGVVDPCGVADGEQPAPGGLPPWLPLVLMLVVLYFFMFRGPKKRQKEHQQMLAEMQKGTKVRTIGGIIGTVVDVRDDEVVVKIDESTNTKMRFARNAISKIYGEDEK